MEADLASVSPLFERLADSIVCGARQRHCPAMCFLPNPTQWDQNSLTLSWHEKPAGVFSLLGEVIE